MCRSHGTRVAELVFGGGGDGARSTALAGDAEAASKKKI